MSFSSSIDKLHVDMQTVKNSVINLLQIYRYIYEIMFLFKWSSETNAQNTVKQ